jgi:pyridinium-3,5-bisthiocarboxylic acid mononucleotide nickel chelatase
MKICYFDAFSGISGDMTVGALLDAGASWQGLQSALGSLNLGATYAVERTKRRGIAASKFQVRGGEQKAHRHLPQVEKIIASGDLTARAKEKAIAVFRRLGEAESRSHDVPLEKVHFHEVGAVDSISDIVGACVALESLGIDEVYASRINVGGGTINTEHGVLPVPAPATAELLKETPIYSAGPETELTTPTGAALLVTLAAGFGRLPAMRTTTQGFGAGDKDFTMQANVLRVLIGERSAATETAMVTVIEANIDDSTPQVLGYAMDRLFEAGALDVALTPIFMKKNRPASQLTVIANPADADALTRVVFAETSTLGVRLFEAQRRVEERRFEEVETEFGRVRMKISDAGFAPEYEDCRELAKAKGVPIKDVLAAANSLYWNSRRKGPGNCE